MSGRISLDDRALDGSAKRLRAAKASLAGLESQLNDGLAGGAPPAIAGEVRGAVAAARHAIQAVEARIAARATELTRRAALTRLANGDGSALDIAIAIRGVAGGGVIHGSGRAKGPDLFDEFTDRVAIPFTGMESALEQIAKEWSTKTIVRNPGVAAAGVKRWIAYLTGRTHWRDVGREIKSHAKVVKYLERAKPGFVLLSAFGGARKILRARGPVEQNKAIGELAGELFGSSAGSKLGSAAGALAGPEGAIVGAIAGGIVGAEIGKSAGGRVGESIGHTPTGKAIGHQIDEAKRDADKVKHSISDAAHEAEHLWKKAF